MVVQAMEATEEVKATRVKLKKIPTATTPFVRFHQRTERTTLRLSMVWNVSGATSVNCGPKPTTHQDIPVVDPLRILLVMEVVVRVQQLLTVPGLTLHNKLNLSLVSNAADSCVVSPASVGGKQFVFFSFGGTLAENQPNGAGIILWISSGSASFVSVCFRCIYFGNSQ